MFGGNIAYGSGFPNAAADDFPNLVPPAPAYLSGHTTVDFTLTKSFKDRFSVSLNALNITNSRLLIDDSLTFGGFHYNNPRELYFQVRYRFQSGI